MSGFFFSGSAASPSNPNETLEFLGHGADGSGTVVTAGGVAHNKGSYATIGTTAADWAYFWLAFGTPSSGSVRYILDIRAGGATIWPDLYIQPASGGLIRVRVPISVPTGTLIDARAQGSAGSASIRASIIGVQDYAEAPPGFTSATALNTIDTTNTRPNATDVPLSNTYTELVASTGAQYGALYAILADNGTNLGLSQQMAVSLATGAAASESEFARFSVSGLASAPSLPRAVSPLIQKTIASGSRLSAKINAATAGTDNARIALYGFA